MNSSSKNTKEDTSENDISEFTNEAVFKGGLGLINTLQKDKDNPLPSSSPNSNPSSTPSPSNTSPEPPSQKASHKILQGLSKQDTPPIPNSSMYSSGFISFRNKKANILPQGITTNNSNKVDDYTDPAVITQSILEKLNSIKPSQNSLDNANFFYNNDSNYNVYNNNKTNYKSEQREIGKMFQNSNAFDDDNIFGIHNSSDEQDEEENKENVFLNIIKHHNDNNNNGIIVNEDNTNEEKEKYINTIVCTLSLLEKGKAIFVSKDDMIFVLPSLFVPKNLKVGNTYMFIVGEYENYHEKSSYIREIQKKYVNK